MLRAAADILRTPRFPIAHGFLVGTIDADRIDFVRRDGFFSGLFNSSVDYDLKRTDDITTKLLFESYVEDRQTFRSAFKTDLDFQRLCGKYAPGLSKLPPADVRNVFGASKYLLQHELSRRLGRTVLVGATDKKLTFGIRNDDAAKFLGVSDLLRFLTEKKVHSFTFNFWYAKDHLAGGLAEDRNQPSHEDVIAEALRYLEEVVNSQMELSLV